MTGSNIIFKSIYKLDNAKIGLCHGKNGNGFCNLLSPCIGFGGAFGSGSDIAAETAGIVLVNSNPRDIVNLVLFGKATYKKMIQNLIWATGYNIVALPLAAGILYK